VRCWSRRFSRALLSWNASILRSSCDF